MSIISQKQIQLSVIALIASNLVPLFGVLFFGWDLFSILFLYWLESLVIGVYNIFKIVIITTFFSLVAVPFFIVHYGGFMYVHLIFITGFFHQGGDDTFFAPLQTIQNTLDATLLFALVSLFISHGVSFFSNFIGKQEYKNKNVEDPMTQPYRRILLMHFTIIFGGFIILALRAPAGALLLMIVLKTIMDIKAHTKEHAVSRIQ